MLSLSTTDLGGSVPKKLDKTQHYDAASDQVWDMLLNTEFVEKKLHAAGATEASAETMRDQRRASMMEA